jgi:hypothetical protein
MSHVRHGIGRWVYGEIRAGGSSGSFNVICSPASGNAMKVAMKALQEKS